MEARQGLGPVRGSFSKGRKWFRLVPIGVRKWVRLANQAVVRCLGSPRPGEVTGSSQQVHLICSLFESPAPQSALHMFAFFHSLPAATCRRRREVTAAIRAWIFIGEHSFRLFESIRNFCIWGNGVRLRARTASLHPGAPSSSLLVK